MKKIQLLILLLSFSFANAQYTAIPDPNFEQELIDDGIDSEGLLNGRILTSDAATTEVLNISGLIKPDISKITDLTGIEAFTVLRVLRCDNNLLTNIDLSQNLNLEELRCYANNLTVLDVSNNTQLTLLHANNNALTRLDVSNNTNLLSLRCFSNSITTLDVTNLNNLTELRCQSNDLRLNLNLSQNPSLTTLTVTTNPDLLCVQVANAADADAGVGIYISWAKDATAVYSEDCEAQFPTTVIPDGSFEDALIALGHDDARDNRVLTSNISGLTALDVSGQNISDLTGIEDFTALEDLRINDNDLIILDLSQNTGLQTLYCNNNNLVSLDVTALSGLMDLNCSNNISLNALDVTQNANLEILNCSNNINLGSIDVTQNTNLEILNCSFSNLSVLNVRFNPFLLELYANFNQLTTLDTSFNAGLQIVQCNNNQITSLDVTANNLLTQLFSSNNQLEGMIDLMQNSFLTDFNAMGNSSLYCIQVADAASADAGAGIYSAWNKDAFAVYSETCSDIVTYVPDDAFEQYLIDQGIDDDLDNYVLRVNVETETTIDVSSLGVADLTGLQDFIALEELYCSENTLTSLDVSQNTSLNVLECGNNQLTSLVLGTSLASLICDDNQLTALDVSQNANLITLLCNNNQLGALDLSANLNITNLDCSSNLISDLDLGANTNLSDLNIADNRLTSVDIVQNVNLTTFLVNDNLLIGGMDVSNQPVLTTFDATNNSNLTCIQVADAGAADTGAGIYAAWLKDATASYSEFCVVSSEEFILLEKSIKVYPNPVRENVFVSVPNDITVKRFTVYNMQGGRVMETQSIGGSGLNLTSLHDGIYFLAIDTGKYTITKKVIVSRKY